MDLYILFCGTLLQTSLVVLLVWAMSYYLSDGDLSDSLWPFVSFIPQLMLLSSGGEVAGKQPFLKTRPNTGSVDIIW